LSPCENANKRPNKTSEFGKLFFSSNRPLENLNDITEVPAIFRGGLVHEVHSGGLWFRFFYTGMNDTTVMLVYIDI
jgi:hypothetical protein